MFPAKGLPFCPGGYQHAFDSMRGQQHVSAFELFDGATISDGVIRACREHVAHQAFGVRCDRGTSKGWVEG
jgi:hypothetical protein